MAQTMSKTKQVTRSVIGWFFCIGFATLGIFSLMSATLTGLCLLVMSATSSPTVRKRLYARFPATSSADINITMIGMLLVAALFQADYRNDQAEQVKAEEKKPALLSSNKAVKPSTPR